jgi:hypothetical protein
MSLTILKDLIMLKWAISLRLISKKQFPTNPTLDPPTIPSKLFGLTVGTHSISTYTIALLWLNVKRSTSVSTLCIVACSGCPPLVN